MTTSAEKVRAHRARKAAGKIILKIVTDETALVDHLVAERLLPLRLVDDHDAIAVATERLLHQRVKAA